ncbi:hypothetical protein NPIL_485991 [Nephila pilipes]|uniref:Uncharacterized protein n=1 Tax=Nephila pilipes TaxID=299642 RepID=A0A8X6PRB6_NEPPI|nr:hypothetical protein NPIL_485991 [Nephila pilipes]
MKATQRNERNRFCTSHKTRATESSQHNVRNETSQVRIKELRQNNCHMLNGINNEKKDRLCIPMNSLYFLVVLDRITFQYNSEIEYENPLRKTIEVARLNVPYR